jgi:hypothetical protein
VVLGLPLPPPPPGSGWRGTLAGERGGGRVPIPNFDEGTYIVVLFTYMYFVSLTYSVLSVVQKDPEQIFLLLLKNLDNRFNKVKTDFSRTIENRNAIPSRS